MPPSLENLLSAPSGLSNNPYATAAQSMLAGFQNTPAPRNNFESFLVPLVQSASVGLANKFAKDFQEDKLFDFYKNNPFVKALQGDASSIGPVASGAEYGAALANPFNAYLSQERPESWSPEAGKQDFLTALLANQKVEEAQKKQEALQDFMFKEQFKAGLDPKNNESWFSKLPSSAQSQAAQSFAIANEAKRISSKIDSLTKKDSTLRFQALSKLSGTDVFELKRQLMAITPGLMRALGEVGALSEGDRKVAEDVVSGNFTSSAADIQRLLNNLGKQINQISKDRLTFFKKAQEDGGNQILNLLEKQSPPNEQLTSSSATVGPDGKYYTFID